MHIFRVIDCISEKSRAIDANIIVYISMYRLRQKIDTFNYVNIILKRQLFVLFEQL